MSSLSTLVAQKPESSVDNKNNVVFNINALPEEILLKIFGYLSQNELGRIARVCRYWNHCTRYPVLWKKANVWFAWNGGSPNAVFRSFTKNLPDNIIQMNLDFRDLRYWRKPINFEIFCTILQKKFPYLQSLILHYIKLPFSLKYAIDLCSLYIPNVQILAFRFSEITDSYMKNKHAGLSKIKILDLCKCIYTRKRHEPLFPKMPYLEILNLSYSTADDYWIHTNTSFLSRLKILNVSGTLIHKRTIEILQNYALNLAELYLCRTFVKNSDFRFNKCVFPHLKKVCLRRCGRITADGIVFLLQSCLSLEDIYVDEVLAETYVNHPFVKVNICKLEIVKNIHHCRHYCKLNYLCQ